MCDKHHFAFNLAPAYRGQAVDQFERSPMHPLLQHDAPDLLGIYALYLTNDAVKPVYVGKATKITLARRLIEHGRKIGGRQNIDPARMWCRYLVISADGEEWVASSAESSLIDHYSPKWNGSGFGGHVPGKGRPGTRINSWDNWYPPKQ
jgi:hypothetical protein